MMNILVLNPPFKGRFSRTSRSPAVTKGGTIYYPFWLAYTVGLLEKEGFEVLFIDSPASGMSSEEMINKVREFKPSLAVLDTSTPSIISDIEIGATIKRYLPKCFVILVGTHPSALPEWTLKQNEKIDAVAIGEYDYTIRDLAEALLNDKDLTSVDGIVYRRAGSEIVRNKKRELIEDLDQLPFATQVYKKHLNIKDYFFAAANYPMVMIITGRGCPFKCFFCVYPQLFHDRRYRLRSAENVVDEFYYVAKYLPVIKEIGIEDDTFTSNRTRTHQICELLIKKKIKMRWYCNVRPDVDLETMKLMKRAGCRLVTVGFESGSQRILDNMHKGLKLEGAKQFAKDAKKVGLLVHGCIMMGNPGETRETIQESIEFAKELNCDSMQYYPLYVYPGTEAYSWAEENGYLGTTDFSQWVTEKGHHNCVISLPDLPAEELVRLCDEALKDYHLRPTYLRMKLKQAIKHPSEGMRTAKSAITFMKYLWQSTFDGRRKETSVKSQQVANNEDIYKQWNKSWSKSGDNMTFAGKLIIRGKQKAIKKLLKGKNVSSAIDVGCGLGYTLNTLKDLGYDVKGIDVSKTAVDICKSKRLPAYHVRLEDEEGKYDLVFSDGLIEHFPDFHPCVKKLVQISRRYVMIAQTDHDTFVVKVLQFLEKIFRLNNLKELDYKIKDFIGAFEENGCRLLAIEPVFFNGYKVLFVEKERQND